MAETSAPCAQELVLIVEAEAVLGLDLADVFEGAGYMVAGPIRTMSEALAWIAQWRPAGAVIDISGADAQDADRLLGELRERGIPMVLLSDRAHAGARPSGTARFVKPIRSADLLAALKAFVPQDSLL